jgi:hypothetical protein
VYDFEQRIALGVRCAVPGSRRDRIDLSRGRDRDSALPIAVQKISQPQPDTRETWPNT